MFFLILYKFFTNVYTNDILECIIVNTKNKLIKSVYKVNLVLID